MSVQAMSWVIEHAPLKGREYLMLFLLSDQASGDEHLLYPPDLARLAAVCRMGEEEAAEVLARLFALGALAHAPRSGPVGEDMVRIVTERSARP